MCICDIKNGLNRIVFSLFTIAYRSSLLCKEQVLFVFMHFKYAKLIQKDYIYVSIIPITKSCQ